MTEEKLPRKRRPRLVVPSQPQEAPRPKIVTRSLVELAQEANLTGTELQEFVDAQSKRLQELQILHVKTNVTGLQLNKVELDAMLELFGPRRGDSANYAETILKSAAASTENPNGLNMQDTANFALKLARMGIHQ